MWRAIAIGVFVGLAGVVAFAQLNPPSGANIGSFGGGGGGYANPATADLDQAGYCINDSSGDNVAEVCDALEVNSSGTAGHCTVVDSYGTKACTMPSDAVIPGSGYTSIIGPSAYGLADVNTAGGHLYLAGGRQTIKATVVDFSVCAGDVITVYANTDASPYMLTEGAQWTAAASNAATALSLETALEATIGDAWTVAGDVVYYSDTNFADFYSITSSDAACAAVVSGDVGRVEIAGYQLDIITATNIMRGSALQMGQIDGDYTAVLNNSDGATWTLANDVIVGWSSTDSAVGAVDIALSRPAASYLQIENPALGFEINLGVGATDGFAELWDAHTGGDDGELRTQQFRGCENQAGTTCAVVLTGQNGAETHPQDADISGPGLFMGVTSEVAWLSGTSASGTLITSLGSTIGSTLVLDGSVADAQINFRGQGYIEADADGDFLFESSNQSTDAVILRTGGLMTLISGTDIALTPTGGDVTLTGTLATTSTITSSGTESIGWSPVAGADTACNTTCTSACVYGFNVTAGNVTGLPLACTDATADVCICAGAN